MKYFSKSQDTEAVGVALIGAGMIAQRHVEALSALGGDVRLLSIVSRHPDKASHLAASYKGPAPLFTSDITAVTQNPDVQIAIVATPPSVRIGLIRSLAVAGKHILLEKPVARNVAESVEVVDICEGAGVLLGVLFQHRVWDSSCEARRLLETGALGSTGYVEIAVPLWREQSYYDELDRGTYARDGGGVLITQAIHTIDLALSLTGAVTRVQAMTATTPLHQMEAEDLAVAGLHFASGAVGSFVASTAVYPHGSEAITLHCNNASLRLDAQAVEISWRNGESERYPSSATDKTTEVKLKHQLHQQVIEDFLDAVRNGRNPMVTGAEALESHRLIEAIEKSSRDGRTVNLPAR